MSGRTNLFKASWNCFVMPFPTYSELIEKSSPLRKNSLISLVFLLKSSSSINISSGENSI